MRLGFRRQRSVDCHPHCANLLSEYTAFLCSSRARVNPSSVSLPTGASAAAGRDYGNLTSSSSVSYDDGGVLKTLTSTAQYDGRGRVIQSVDRNNGQVNTSYDAMGRVVSRTNPFIAGGTPGPATTFQYDALGRITITTLPDGNTVQNLYSGATVTATDQVGRKIKREVDSLGRLIKVTEQDGAGALTQETSYSYNMLDKLTVVNQGNQTRSYKYDAVGRLLYELIPEQSATINDGTGTMWSSKYTYTEFSAVATKQDARGAVKNYTYDALHRVSSISYNTTNAPGAAATAPVNLSYTTWGALSTVSLNLTPVETYSFDSNLRVSSLTRTIDSKSYTTSYEYNGGNQTTKLTYPSGAQVNLSYDDRGRLGALKDQVLNPYANGMTYNVEARQTGFTFGNGVVATYGFDTNRSQLVSQTASKNGTSLMNLSYSYQASAGQSGANTTAGNSHQMISISGTIDSTTESAGYTYDLQKRLVTSSQTTNGASVQRRFAYDRWGNRTGMWDAVTGGNQIQTIALQQNGVAPTNRITSVTGGSTVNYTYDAAGNLTHDGAHAYTYDAENRVVSVDGGATAQYSYDHQNQRVKKVSGGATTHYIWEDGHVIAEHDGTAAGPWTTKVEYISLKGRMIATRQYTVGQQQSTAIRYYLSDLWGTRLAPDASGNVLGRQAHLPFGEEFAGSGTQEKHHFTSYEADVESATDYAVNRHYSQSVGRFGSADPYQASGYVVDPQSWN
ncbi:MAG: hypothetical protein WAV47_15335, partial [Blastocatellia bacterium]